MGYQAGFGNSIGGRNTFIGVGAGYGNTEGGYNTFVGHSAGLSNTIGTHNSFIGRGAGASNTSGISNSFLGSSSGSANTEGNQNCFIGSAAGQENTTGSFNTFIGRAAGFLSVTGTSNVAIGAGAGPTVSNTDSHMKLYIDVDTSFSGNNDPLIYGEFDNNLVRINGVFEATGGVGNGSSVELKENFREISPDEILEKLATLRITQWNYLSQPEVNHIGPTSEEFNATFGLTGSQKIISTLDVDGITIAAIQALKSENQQLRQNLRSLEEKLSRLESQIRLLTK